MWRQWNDHLWDFFYVRVTAHHNKFLYNKNQIDALVSQIFSGMKLYMFQTVRLSIIRSLFTVHSAMVYVRMELGFFWIEQNKSSSSWFYYKAKHIRDKLDLCLTILLFLHLRYSYISYMTVSMLMWALRMQNRFLQKRLVDPPQCLNTQAWWLTITYNS
jgi:hypothetical protein